MRDWENNPPTEEEMDKATEYHEALMEAARERWPEMVDEPAILPLGPGITSVIFPVPEAEGMNLSLRERWTKQLQQDFKTEKIEIEQVGLYHLGYSARLEYLCIGHRA